MRYIIGIDEVGRGSLAGPLTVAAVCIPRGFRITNVNLGRLRDSKQLTPKRREAWFHYLKAHPKVRYALARVYPRKIERINISRAANHAALRAFQRLTESYNLKPNIRKAYLDGGLYLGNGKSRMTYSAKTVVRGDQKFAAIQAASIIAKVSRDRFMKRLAERYPKYGFEIHKGYGTKRHLRAIKKYGPSEAHRLTFIRFS